MPPSVNKVYAGDDASSLESFEQVHVVRDDESDDDEQLEVPSPVNLNITESTLEPPVVKQGLIKAVLCLAIFWCAYYTVSTGRTRRLNELEINAGLLARIDELETELASLRNHLLVANQTIEELQTKHKQHENLRIGRSTVDVELDAVPHILMRDVWSELEEDVAEALNTLLIHAQDGQQEYRSQFLGAGGHSNVVLVMARWSSSATIQYLGCQILGQLPPELHKHAASVGALEVALAAMENFAEDENVQTHAIFALYHLCVQNKGNMLKLVQRLDALPSILYSMQWFPDSVVLQFWGCRLLEALSMKNQFRDSIIYAGGLVVLGEIMSKWPQSRDDRETGVMEIARVALANLVKEPTAFSE